jgi:hypothetical protein
VKGWHAGVPHPIDWNDDGRAGLNVLITVDVGTSRNFTGMTNQELSRVSVMSLPDYSQLRK